MQTHGSYHECGHLTGYDKYFRAAHNIYYFAAVFSDVCGSIYAWHCLFEQK